MLKEHLYEEILIKPAEEVQADGLLIVAGYVFSSMALRHMNDLRRYIRRREFHIDLVVGMVPDGTLHRKDHEGFLRLANQNDRINFKCSYVSMEPAVHSKLYIWTLDQEPYIAYVGSANYSQTAFLNRREVFYECCPDEAFDYFMEVQVDTIDCRTPDIENTVAVIDTKEKELEDEDSSVLSSNNKVIVSLLQQNGEIHKKSGLNWGQRDNRDRNEAYIPINNAEIKSSGFFPDTGTYFNVRTDDGSSMIFVRAQAGGKALETPLSNSILGLYFRERMGLESGAFVYKDDLLNYGRTNVEFYKIDDGYYYMDFSV